ncbi:asparagine synthase (glutamine-hydrolyzing) [Meiothermus ruber]|uniref:asparagine synthase (glutamine-hydrolyzing) n=1 Tax=Meiothermus ruber TaxID=277 RepID=UPI00034CF0C4|nr:asparagine synthase (glutamine-hydrolyzing) [Meiothermus ruber]GAO74053.1 asparagine synthase [Meiothermus ruber H328]
MCGIAGAFSTSQPMPELTKLVGKIVNSQLPRGPDHQAVVELPQPAGQLVLGHNRLSIIDLSEHSNQPLWDHSRRYCIVFNGEIYNYLELRAELQALGHRFQTQGDTEVILEAYKAWGKQAWERFIGMFAFALLDTQAGQLWLVRDRFGVKPLFYHLQHGLLAFASSTEALAQHFGLSPNLEYVSRGLFYYVYEDDSEISPYTGLHALPAGHHACVQLSQPSIEPQPYYDLKSRVEQKIQALRGMDEKALLEELEATLHSAVQLRLRSDVPLAVSLSGGLDSSLVAALAAQQHQRVVGFCYGHPQAPRSEGPLARELAQKAGIEVHFVWPELSKERLIQAFEKTLAAQDAPFPTLSILAQNFVYEAARNEGYKVLLGGQGGDEGFMGYRKFFLFQLRYLLAQKQYLELAGFALGLARLLSAELYKLGLFWQNRQRYFGGPTQGNLRLPSVRLVLGTDHRQAPWLRQMLDVTRYSLPTLLRYEDRNSMGHSIESRLPFLDYRVLELGLALPVHLKLRHGYGKWALRQVAQGKIPDSIRTARYKRGFDVTQSWLAAGLGSHLQEQIQAAETVLREVLAPNLNLAQTYSPAQMQQQPHRLAEAISLVWLARKLSS